MKSKNIFQSLFILVFLLASCRQESITSVPVTQTSTATQLPTAIPSSTPLALSPLPTVGFGLSNNTPYPTAIPYPTASEVQSKAVAFIERDRGGKLLLWVANVDGSGERILTEIEENGSNNHLLKWSPDGKWISYISGDYLWIISPDGAAKKKILPTQSANANKRIIRQYTWSSDSETIAYALAGSRSDFVEIETGFFVVKTDRDIKLDSYISPATIALSWSPNKRYLLFNKSSSFFIYETELHQILKQIQTETPCWATWNDGIKWSSDSEWFYHTHHSTGRYSSSWICISGVDGSTHRIDIEGTVSTPIWDKTRNFLYFIARKTNPDSDPNLKIDERLMRYDVRNQKMERLLSLREIQTYGYIGQVSISPDGSALVIQTQDSENQVSYILIDLKTFSLKKFTHETFCKWSADSKSFICLQGSNDHSVFHNLNVETDVTRIFSGEHAVKSWSISP